MDAHGDPGRQSGGGSALNLKQMEKEMKNSMKSTLLVGVMGAAGILCACNDAEYDPLDTRVFISESVGSSSRSEKVSISGEGADVEVTACLSHVVKEDVVLRFEVDAGVLETYNREQSTSFEVLPETCFEMASEVTIPAGSYSGQSLRIHIFPFGDGMSGARYALPLRLVSVSGGVPTTSATSTYVITTEQVFTSTLPMFIGNAGLTVPGFSRDLPQFTVECRFQVSDTRERNRAVFTNGGSVLLRFEDPQSEVNGIPAHSFVQFQGTDDYLNPSTDYFHTNKWQHLALTSDGSSVTLYYNGARAATMSYSCGSQFSGVAWFGGDAGGGHGTGDSKWWAGCKILCSELRLWSVCRTEAQIRNDMTMTSATSSDLVGYWRMDRSGSDVVTDGGTTLYTFEDCTGNGYTLETTVAPQWVEGIKSTDTETAWPE